MANIKIKIKGIDELRQGLDRAPKVIETELKDGLRKSTELIKQKARRKAGSPPIVFKGELARSIQARVTGFRGIVGAEAKHAPFVEFGTKPHFPPIAPLERWAQLKLGKPGAGFAIAKKISERGTKAQPYFEPAIEESQTDIVRIFDNVGEVIINRL